MGAADRIIAQVQRLPAGERRRVLRALATPRKKIAKRRAVGQRHRKGRYAGLLALGGTVQADVTDLSADKYKYFGGCET